MKKLRAWVEKYWWMFFAGLTVGEIIRLKVAHEPIFWACIALAWFLLHRCEVYSHSLTKREMPGHKKLCGWWAVLVKTGFLKLLVDGEEKYFICMGRDEVQRQAQARGIDLALDSVPPPSA